MTSDYYFKKWRKTLSTLESLVQLDIDLQITKAHDKEICEAAQRLNGMLGSYVAHYNDALECLQLNLQIQKTQYILDVVKAIVARILELKEQLRHLEGAHNQFLTNGLIDHKITPYNVEFSGIPHKHERPDCVKVVIDEALQTAKDMKDKENIQNIEGIETNNDKEVVSLNLKWWEDNVEKKDKKLKGINVAGVYEVEEKISEETLRRKVLIALIQAHEKNRQVTRKNLHRKQNRELWEKELKGILKPPAPIALREKSAHLIQKVFRYYFEIKRNRIRECKLDEKLNLTLCTKSDMENVTKDKEMKANRSLIFNSYQKQWNADCETYKQKYLKRNGDDFADEFRSFIREWFHKWYREAKFFYDIPKENENGTTAIIKEDVLTPSDWLDKYETYLEEKKANKGKTPYQLKLEKQEAAEEEMILKREELKKKKLEVELLKKIMKNPTLHPGYQYPPSKKTHVILEAIDNYHKDWNDLDNEDSLSVKEKYIKIVDEERICMEAKLYVCKSVENDMREELKLLKKGLKEEYKRNGEEIPKQIKERTKKKKLRKLKPKIIDKNKISEQLTDLAIKGHLKEYPVTNLEDFLGDSNYAGADLRCAFQQSLPFGGETRALWWEKCREVIHGFKRILLVGPKGTGKTTLVHTMATVNDAILYEFDLLQIELDELNVTAQYLRQIVNSVATCAIFTQPSIIYIKHVHQLYRTKARPEMANRNFDLIKRFFIRKLFKKFHKHDDVTIIGSCIDPWTTKSRQVLRTFTSVVLLPQTNYSTVHVILKNWMLNNRMVPRTLDIESLAYVLQGYSFGYLKTALDGFLTADMIVKIAAYGLKAEDIYNYILEDDKGSKYDYEKYVKWYTDKTHWGRLEKKRLEEQVEFKLLVKQWKEKMKKKNNNFDFHT